MNYLNEFERELEDFLPMEVDLDPNIVEEDEDNFEDQLTLLESLGFQNEDVDYPAETEVELLETSDFDEYYGEGRREKANESRSKQNWSRSITNNRNIVKVNREVVRIKKTSLRNTKTLRNQVKRSRLYEMRNRKAHRRIKIDMGRFKRAVRTVGFKSDKNAKLIEQMSVMAIPKAIGNLAAPFATSELGKAIPGIVSELAILIPPSKKINKWALAAIVSAGVGALPFLADWLDGIREETSESTGGTTPPVVA